MTNGDEYIPILPNFEVYRTRLSHGREPAQVSTDVIGIKCEPRDAKLLGEFLATMASETSSHPRDGIYLPRGSAYLLGPPVYEQVLKENNFFLTNVATIPVNLEYATWFAVIDPQNNSANEPISLHEHLLRKPWFIQLESAGNKKCIIVTTRPNLPEACAWIDGNLEKLIRKSIPTGIDPPSSLLPRRLDKPVYSATNQMYADILKKQFSLASNQSTMTTENNRPPRKRQATILDYATDPLAEYPSLAPTTTLHTISTAGNQSPNPPPTSMSHQNYATDLLSLKSEINQLKQIIAQAVEKITTAIKSLHATDRNVTSTDMETDATPTITNDTTTAPLNLHSNQLDLPAIIQELKTEIATITTETRKMFQQLLPPQSNTTTSYSPAT